MQMVDVLGAGEISVQGIIVVRGAPDGDRTRDLQSHNLAVFLPQEYSPLTPCTTSIIPQSGVCLTLRVSIVMKLPYSQGNSWASRLPVILIIGWETSDQYDVPSTGTPSICRNAICRNAARGDMDVTCTEAQLSGRSDNNNAEAPAFGTGKGEFGSVSKLNRYFTCRNSGFVQIGGRHSCSVPRAA